MKKFIVFVLVVFLAFVVGCDDGDNGKDGASGADGINGVDGQDGTDGPSFDELMNYDIDGDGVVYIYDDCAKTPADSIVDENGCSCEQLFGFGEISGDYLISIKNDNPVMDHADTEDSTESIISLLVTDQFCEKYETAFSGESVMFTIVDPEIGYFLHYDEEGNVVVDADDNPVKFDTAEVDVVDGVAAVTFYSDENGIAYIAAAFSGVADEKTTAVKVKNVPEDNPDEDPEE